MFHSWHNFRNVFLSTTGIFPRVRQQPVWPITLLEVCWRKARRWKFPWNFHFYVLHTGKRFLLCLHWCNSLFGPFLRNKHTRWPWEVNIHLIWYRCCADFAGQTVIFDRLPWYNFRKRGCAESLIWHRWVRRRLQRVSAFVFLAETSACL